MKNGIKRPSDGSGRKGISPNGLEFDADEAFRLSLISVNERKVAIEAHEKWCAGLKGG